MAAGGGDPGAGADGAAGETARAGAWWRADWSGFSWKLGLLATVVMAAIILASRHFGAIGLFAGMGALQALLAIAAQPMQVRPMAAFWFAALGVGATALAGEVARDHASAVIALAAVAFLAASGQAVGPVVARMTNVMALWFLTAVALLESETDFSRPALGFFAGSALVFGALEVVRMAKGIRLDPPPPLWPRVRAQLAWGSPLLIYATVYALAGAVALWLGWLLVPGNRVWAAAAALVLVRPVARESLARSVKRLAGTAFGAWLVVAVIGRIDDPRLLVLLALGATFMMAATLKVDYTIFAAFLTAQVVAMAALSGRDAMQTGEDRILATLIGAVVAVTATLILRLVEGQGSNPGQASVEPAAVAVIR